MKFQEPEWLVHFMRFGDLRQMQLLYRIWNTHSQNAFVQGDHRWGVYCMSIALCLHATIWRRLTA